MVSRRKWLSRRTVWNCLRVSGAILVIATVFKIAEDVVVSDLPMLQRIPFFIIMWLFLAFLVWFLGLLSPELMDAVLRMLGFEEKEESKEKED